MLVVFADESFEMSLLHTVLVNLDGLAHVLTNPSCVETIKQSFLNASDVNRSFAIRLHISGSIICT
jgi:hypothetical protein